MPQPLLSCCAITKAFTYQPLFQALDLGLFDRDRLAIIGPNGSGKSTLLQIMAGIVPPDEGTIAQRRETSLCYVPQQTAFAGGGTVESILRSAAARRGGEREEIEKRLQQTMSRARFVDPQADASRLSGGWQKRLAIAAGLVQQPDLLLLDEPTNHLDLDGILWLETILTTATFAWTVVTHDRYFLERTAARVLELNKIYAGGYLLVRGAYDEYLERRAQCLDAQSQLRAALASKVRRETSWLRRGPKARTTKAKARIDQAEKLTAELQDADARLRMTKTEINFTASERKTKKLIEVKHVAKSYEGKKIVEGLHLLLSPGLRIGILGLNGSGKTTILKLLAKQLRPDHGSVIHATDLTLAYFEQNRAQLNPEWTLKRALCESGDSVLFQGKPVHVANWAKRFHFRADQLDVPVGDLSGGEQARLALARLMLQPVDILLLDEPTNDLDIPALEALEESLLDFAGCVVVVSHDRYLLGEICHGFIGLLGNGTVHYYGDYEQWEQKLTDFLAAEAKQAKQPADVSSRPTTPRRNTAKKLSYLEQREYDEIENNILAAEETLESCQKAIEDPVIVIDHEKLEIAVAAWQEAQAAVEKLYARWAELDEKRAELMGGEGGKE